VPDVRKGQIRSSCSRRVSLSQLAVDATTEAAARAARGASVESADGPLKSAARFETMPVRVMIFIEAMRVAEAVVAAVKEWRPVDYNRRVEAPAERAVDNSRAGNKGVATKPGVPIPSRSEPARTPIYVKASLSDARFRQIFGSQRRLAEEIILVVAGVEIPCFCFGIRAQDKLSFLAQSDFSVAYEDLGLAFEDANGVLIGVETIQAVLQDSCGHAVFIDTDIVILN